MPFDKAIVEKLAQYVAQSNGEMEATVRERQRGNPQFAFLFGGEGAEYGACALGTDCFDCGPRLLVPPQRPRDSLATPRAPPLAQMRFGVPQRRRRLDCCPHRYHSLHQQHQQRQQLVDEQEEESQ